MVSKSDLISILKSNINNEDYLLTINSISEATFKILTKTNLSNPVEYFKHFLIIISSRTIKSTKPLNKLKPYIEKITSFYQQILNFIWNKENSLLHPWSLFNDYKETNYALMNSIYRVLVNNNYTYNNEIHMIQFLMEILELSDETFQLYPFVQLVYMESDKKIKTLKICLNLNEKTTSTTTTTTTTSVHLKPRSSVLLICLPTPKKPIPSFSCLFFCSNYSKEKTTIALLNNESSLYEFKQTFLNPLIQHEPFLFIDYFILIRSKNLNLKYFTQWTKGHSNDIQSLWSTIQGSKDKVTLNSMIIFIKEYNSTLNLSLKNTDTLQNLSRDQLTKSITHFFKNKHKILNIINIWSYQIKRNINDTPIRLMYHKLFIENILSPKPGVYSSTYMNQSNVLNFFNCLQSPIILPIDSASRSLCFTGFIRLPENIHISDETELIKKFTIQYMKKPGIKVFVKMTTDYDSTKKFKEVEPIIYEKVIHKIITDRASPHFMLFLGYVKVNDWIQFLNNSIVNSNVEPIDSNNTITNNTNTSNKRFLYQKEQIQQSFLERFDIEEDNKPVGGSFLITECGYGISLSSYLTSVFKSTSESDRRTLYNIMFQVLYTLSVMSRYKLTHYDLHLGNIYLEDLSKYTSHPEFYVYFINETEYVVLVLNKYLAKVFDFDWSFHPDHLTEPQKESRHKYPCQLFGVCNEHNIYFDVFKICSQLYTYRKYLPASILDFMNKYILKPSKSKNLNENLIKRIEYCDGKTTCNVTLCELNCKNKEKNTPSKNKVKNNNHLSINDKYKCNCTGGWDVKKYPDSMYPIDSILTFFIQHFKQYIPIYTLDYDRRSILDRPNIWEEKVFALDKDLFDKVKQNYNQNKSDNNNQTEHDFPHYFPGSNSSYPSFQTPSKSKLTSSGLFSPLKKTSNITKTSLFTPLKNNNKQEQINQTVENTAPFIETIII